MAKILPLLNLNKTPQKVQSNSIIFSKNIRVDKDGAIIKDNGVEFVTATKDNEKIVGIISDNNRFFIFKEKSYISRNKSKLNTDEYVDETFNNSYIIEYDERTGEERKIDCAWTYSGGTIDGKVISNLVGDTIIIVNEYGIENKNIPLKYINIDRSSKEDDESIYTQSPKIPFINLYHVGYHSINIPNGVYQFFVRYEIKKDFYTKWFPCSKELFSGTIRKKDTIQGTVQYINTNLNSSQSFILQVEKLVNNNYNYLNFQIGFILSSDDTVVARSWKKFSFDTTDIYFDYDEEYIQEVNIDEMLESVYQVFNVGNVTTYKNKIYISNYNETNFNPKLDENLISQSDIELKYLPLDLSNNSEIQYTFNGKVLQTTNVNGHTYISGVNDLYASINSIYNQFIIENYIYDDDSTENHINWNNNKIYNFRYSEYTNLLADNTLVKMAIRDDFDKSNLKVELRWFSRNIENIIPDYLYTVNDVKTYGCASVDEITIKLQGSNDSIIIPVEDFLPEIKDGRRKGTIYPWELKALYEDRHINKNNLPSEVTEVDADFGMDIPSSSTVYMPNDDFHWNTKNAVMLFVIHALHNSSNNADSKLGYINPNGGFVTLSGKNIESMTIKYNHYFYSYGANVKYGDITNTNNWIKAKYIQAHTATVTFHSNITSVNEINENKISYNTLLPYKNYDFYIHFVTERGEITNGYKIGEAPILESVDEYHTRIYPKINNIFKPDGYKYCFISYCETEHNIAELTNPNEDKTLYDCVDVDTLLKPLLDNIPIYTIDSDNVKRVNNHIELGEPDFIGTYYNSGDANKDNLDLFGASGKIKLNKPNTDGLPLFIVNKNIKNKNKTNLIKCTPYILLNDSNPVNYPANDNDTRAWNNYNINGYLCSIYKPTYEEFNRYISGSDIYNKITKDSIIDLQQNKNKQIIVSTPNYIIYSENNLSYLILSDDNFTTLRTYNIGDDVESQIIARINSLTLCEIYDFPSMYKDYTRKLFNPINDFTQIRFDNTIRSSNTIVDERIYYIGTFNSTDYYNVPTDKGKIVNLKAIANNILVHTTDSIYAFSGNNNLGENEDGGVQLKETDVFDTGIKEIVGAEFGYAGLQNKDESIITYNGYVFRDKDTNTIFAYSGQGQIAPISDSIIKLLNFKDIIDVRFADDYYNDRFFITIHFVDNYVVTLSYNFRFKGFVSLHDFTFDKSFNTKANTYFVYNDSKIYGTIRYHKNNIEQSVSYKELSIVDKLYPQLNGDTQDSYKSIIDIICTDNYETIKTLNSINWICSEINKNFIDKDIDKEDIRNLLMSEEQLNRDYPGDYIRIYSDITATKLIEILGGSKDYAYYNSITSTGEQQVKLEEERDVNANKFVNKMKYDLPFYNNGIWTFNYFRDCLHNKDITKSNSFADNQGLILGKYFVVRFVFNNKINFKLENIIFNFTS